jgi:4-amino-4-deoxy-L-arabinose transferase-like glycosyltransferase
MTKPISSFWIVAGLVVLYLFTRLYNLLVLPIFTDEAIYLYWGKFISQEHSHYFLALTDGKSPLLTWIFALLMSIFPREWYLVAGRLPSVGFGLLTVLASYKIATLLFQSSRTGLLVSLLCIFSPFLLLYDRLALYDAQLTAMLSLSVFFALKTSKTMSLRDAFLWGLFLGLGFLAKPPALLFLFLTPVCFLILLSLKTIREKWKKILLIILIVILISEGLNNLQRISSAYPQAVVKNQQFQQPIEILLKNPFMLTLGNLRLFIEWLFSYYTPILFFAVLIGFAGLLARKRKAGIVFLMLWFVPIFALATVGREVFPRYLLFVTPYAMLPLAYVLSSIWQKNISSQILFFCVLLILLFLPLRFSFFLLTDPTRAPLPLSDYNQLIAEHPSGYGLDKVFSYIRQKSENKQVTVVTQGTFGLYPYAFYLEFWGQKNVRILPKWPLERLDEEVFAAKKDGEVIVVLKEKKDIPPELRELSLIAKIQKPNSDRYPILLTILK